jgi:large conductance mechanosensitive channel
MSFWKEFKEFLKEYKIIGLAIAFIIGSALTTLVQSLVNDVMMLFLSLLLPKGDWLSATLQLGPVIIKWGILFGRFNQFHNNRSCCVFNLQKSFEGRKSNKKIIYKFVFSSISVILWMKRFWKST